MGVNKSMQEIRLDQLSNSTSNIPVNMKPHRFVISTNLLVPLYKKNDGYYLRLYNMDPDHWNTWFPFYYTTETSFNPKATCFKELFFEAQSFIGSAIDKDYRKERLKELFTMETNLVSIFIQDSKLVPNRCLLKFSAAKHLWSLYIIEYYLSVKTDGNLSNQFHQYEYCDIALEEMALAKTIRTGAVKGIPIVENIIDLLKKPEIVNLFKQKALIL